MATDPRAQPILDLIGAHEAPGGYNQRYAEPTSGPFQYELTSMTLDEVINLPYRRIRGKNYSASGRYQFLKATLKGLKDRLNLTGRERFDAPFQDYLAFELMRGRGFDQWIGGSLRTNAFALNLAKEWASLPVLARTQGAHRRVEAGQSYYAGDGVNSAQVTATEFAGVLNAALSRPEPVPEPPRQPDDPGVEPGFGKEGGAVFGFLLFGLLALAVKFRKGIWKAFKNASGPRRIAMVLLPLAVIAFVWFVVL